MNKVVSFLEKHVQWVALGLGALFMLYMLYGYVLQNPVTTQVAGNAVDLGNIDRVTLEGPARQLEAAMRNDAVINIPVEPVVPKIRAALAGNDEKTAVAAAPLDKRIWDAPTQPVPGMNPVVPPGTNVAGRPGGTGIPGRPGSTQPNIQPGQAAPVIAKLPVPPAAQFVNFAFGRSAVTPMPVEGQTPQVGPDGQPLTVDKTWVNFHYRVPVAALAQSFTQAGIPQTRRFTTFLRVELVRQERLSADQWGEEFVVAPLELAFTQAPLWPVPGVPNQQTEQDYMTWANANAQAILQPVFYQVVKGDVPGLPGDPILQAGVPAAQPQVFDPLNPGRGPFTDEQKELIRKARAEQYKKQQEERRNRPRTAPQPRTPRGGRGGEDIPAEMFAPRDNDRPVLLAQARPYSQPYGGPAEGMLPEEMGMDDMGGMGGIVLQQQNNQALVKLAASLPKQSPFDPAVDLTQDVDIIAYDETPEPGKTYRYRMRYYVFNPVYGAVNLVAQPALAEQFALVSAPSDWTTPVDVPAAVDFFLASGGVGGADSVKLDLFKWQNGNVNKTTQTLSPGDRVGLTTKDGVDYNTPWTLVDVRVGGGDRYVLLQDDKGNAVRREFKVDSLSPRRRDLDAQYTAAQAALANDPNNPNNLNNPNTAIAR